MIHVKLGRCEHEYFLLSVFFCLKYFMPKKQKILKMKSSNSRELFSINVIIREI